MRTFDQTRWAFGQMRNLPNAPYKFILSWQQWKNKVNIALKNNRSKPKNYTMTAFSSVLLINCTSPLSNYDYHWKLYCIELERPLIQISRSHHYFDAQYLRSEVHSYNGILIGSRDFHNTHALVKGVILNDLEWSWVT